MSNTRLARSRSSLRHGRISTSASNAALYRMRAIFTGSSVTRAPSNGSPSRRQAARAWGGLDRSVPVFVFTLDE
jgi:hypothetical protein